MVLGNPPHTASNVNLGQGVKDKPGKKSVGFVNPSANSVKEWIFKSWRPPVFLAAVVLIVGLLVGGGSYLAMSNRESSLPDTSTITSLRSTPKPALYPAPINTPTPTLTAIPAPTDWQTYSNTKYRFSIKYPPNTVIEELSPGTPSFCATNLPECVIEEQVFLATISHTDTVGDVLTFKLVKKPPNKSVDEMAEYFSQECLKSIASPFEQVTLSKELQGYKYSCQGLGIVTHFWAPFENHPDTLLGASWFSEEAALAEQIIGTIQFH